MRTCCVCSAPLTWPCLEFCSPTCAEKWIAQAREKEPTVLVPRKR